MQKLGAVLFLLVTLSVCGGSGASKVEMVDAQRFEPQELTVASGDTISFKNVSSEAHTVTAYADEIPADADYFTSGGLASEEAAQEELSAGLVAAGDTYELTLEQPGTYRYFCIPHEEAGMKGTVVVEG